MYLSFLQNHTCTALYFINREGHEKIAELLIQHGKADVHVKNEEGNTPLHLACW